MRENQNTGLEKAFCRSSESSIWEEQTYTADASLRQVEIGKSALSSQTVWELTPESVSFILPSIPFEGRTARIRGVSGS
jgi:hypothetical protein